MGHYIGTIFHEEFTYVTKNDHMGTYTVLIDKFLDFLSNLRKNTTHRL